jgi:hypothetical protein
MPRRRLSPQRLPIQGKRQDKRQRLLYTKKRHCRLSLAVLCLNCSGSRGLTSVSHVPGFPPFKHQQQNSTLDIIHMHALWGAAHGYVVMLMQEDAEIKIHGRGNLRYMQPCAGRDRVPARVAKAIGEGVGWKNFLDMHSRSEIDCCLSLVPRGTFATSHLQRAIR